MSLKVRHSNPEVSDKYLRIVVTPEEQGEDADGELLLTVPPTLVLHVKYTENYPDEVPQVAITVREDQAGVFGEAPEATDEEAPEDIPESDQRPGTQELLRSVIEAVSCC